MFGFGSKDEDNANVTRAVFKADKFVIIAPTEPSTILSNAIDKLETERNYHAGKMMELELIIADANARLLNHTAAHDAINTALRPLVEPFTLTNEDLTDVQEQTPNSGIGATEFPIDGSIGDIDESGGNDPSSPVSHINTPRRSRK